MKMKKSGSLFQTLSFCLGKMLETNYNLSLGRYQLHGENGFSTVYANDKLKCPTVSSDRSDRKFGVEKRQIRGHKPKRILEEMKENTLDRYLIVISTLWLC